MVLRHIEYLSIPLFRYKYISNNQLFLLLFSCMNKNLFFFIILYAGISVKFCHEQIWNLSIIRHTTKFVRKQIVETQKGRKWCLLVIHFLIQCDTRYHNYCTSHAWDSCEHVDMMVRTVLVPYIGQVARKHPTWSHEVQLKGK